MSSPSQVAMSARGGWRGSGGFRGAPQGQGGSGGRGRGRSWGSGARRGGSAPSSEARPTHFLALPLDQHQGLRDRISRFTNGILAASPLPEGVDASIIQPTPRLHITLGVMALAESTPAASEGPSTGTAAAPPQKTIANALQFLESLRPEILAAMKDDTELRVPLTGLYIMNNNPTQASVLWTGPGSVPDDSALWTVSLLVHNRFKEAGYVTETRPLKLHCTLMNSSFRKPRAPFSSTSVLERVAKNPSLAGIASGPRAALSPTDVEKMADFGTWGVNEIHLYRMGSWDKDRRYVSVGHIP